MKRTHEWAGGAGRGLALLAAAALAVVCLLTAVGNLSTGSGEAGRARLEESIRRSAVACYAAEGVYPATLEDLEQRYGLQVDESRYAVYYEVFASNLMPDITVLLREET